MHIIEDTISHNFLVAIHSELELTIYCPLVGIDAIYIVWFGFCHIMRCREGY